MRARTPGHSRNEHAVLQLPPTSVWIDRSNQRESKSQNRAVEHDDLIVVRTSEAGTLLGGALFHLIPEGVKSLGALRSGVWILAGFAAFLALEQFLHWHHSHRASLTGREPVMHGAASASVMAGWQLAIPRNEQPESTRHLCRSWHILIFVIRLRT